MGQLMILKSVVIALAAIAMAINVFIPADKKALAHRGRLGGVDQDAKRLKIRTETADGEELTFEWDHQTRFRNVDGPISVTDLKPNDRVRVHFHKARGKRMLAERVELEPVFEHPAITYLCPPEMRTPLRSEAESQSPTETWRTG